MNGWLKGFYVAALASSVMACRYDVVQPDVNLKKTEPKTSTVSLWKQSHDAATPLKKYSSAKQEWRAVMATLEEDRKKNGFFAPSIDSLYYTKAAGNCYSAAIGVELKNITRPSPGIIAHIATTKSQGDSAMSWTPRYKGLADFAANLERDGVKHKISEEERADYFPVIALFSKTRDWNFHFVRPFLKRDEKGDTVIAFSEKQSWVYDVRNFNNIDCLKKAYDENQEYIHPTIFYAPKEYLGSELSLTD